MRQKPVILSSFTHPTLLLLLPPLFRWYRRCYLNRVQISLWYELQGDYYIPCLILAEEETQPIGLWGQRHKQYLKEHRHIVYTTMLIDGTLNRYLADINQQAEQMFHRLIEEMVQKQGVTEQLKAEQPMEWIG